MRRVLVAVAVLLALGVLFAVLPVERWVLELVAWVRGAGALGPVVFGALYVVACLLMVPGTPLSLAAGFAWGPLGGFLVVWPSATLGATAAFALSRTLLRDRVRPRDPRLRAIDAAVAERGLSTVLLLRLSPVVPFNALNYALGASSPRLRDFAVGTALGIVPGALVLTWAGSTVPAASRLLSGEVDAPGRQALYWAGLAATVVVALVLGRAARRALADRTADRTTDRLPEDP